MECTVSWTGGLNTRSGMGFVAETGSGHVLVMDGAVEDPNARGMFLEQIAEQADRQQTLIEDLLSLARIEAGVAGGS